MGKTAAEVFCGTTITIELQEVGLEHGGVASWAIHFL
jgi:hypothetical protein